MVVISKEDLYYKDYSWSVYANDDSHVTGQPDSTLLNRKEGYEIVYFINKFCEIYKFEQKASAQKVEKMIRNEVPENIRSQTNIKEWIATNWKNSNY
ncbi:MAG: hypothetical protein ACOYOT_04590 [Bacteroidales bacterium]